MLTFVFATAILAGLGLSLLLEWVENPDARFKLIMKEPAPSRGKSLWAAVILALGGVAAYFAEHTADAKSQVQSCSTACISHGQPAVASSQKENKDEDDKEPSPPTISWQQSPTDLRLLYITPIFVVLWFDLNVCFRF